MFRSMFLSRRPARFPQGMALVLTVSLLASLVATTAGTAPQPARATGTTAPRYQDYAAPDGLGTNAGEPSIGVNWQTGNVMYEAGLQTLRVTFNDATSPAQATWVDKSAPNALASLDPILFTDHSTGRTQTSQLTGQDSLSAYTDDDGESYTPSQGGGLPSGVDHQTIGGGPYVPGLIFPTPLYPHAVYYCSQDIATAFCARSDNGGLTFGPGVPIYTTLQCNGLHGHVQVAPDGTAYVPNNNCGYAGPLSYTGQGAVVSTDNGLTWTVHQVVDAEHPEVAVNPGDSDPALGIGAGGRAYFGLQNKVTENGAVDSPPFIGVSDDRGQTWHHVQRIGTELGIKNSVFPAVVAGDNDRAAFAFLGTTTGGDYQATGVFSGVWHLYVASTFDGGQTWTTADATPADAVQRGSICTSGTTCGSDRNLLDFIGITTDHQGRVLVAYADGCINGCVAGGANSFTALASIARQAGGSRLFAQYDPVEPARPAAPLLTATRDSGGVHLSWPAPDNGGAAITGYKVYRGTAPGGETLQATLGAVQSYNDTTATGGGAYYYQVSAVNAAGEGPRSPEVQPVAPVVQNVCVLPGALVTTDSSDAAPNLPPDSSVDIKDIYVAEPYFADGSNKLVFTMHLGAASSAPPSSQWYFIWNRPAPDANADRNYVAMKTDATGAPSFEYGQISPPNVNLPTRLGATEGGAFVPGTLTSTIVITVADNHLDNIGPGSDVADLQGRVFFARPDGAPVSQNTTSDYSPTGTYTLRGNAACRPAQPDLTITGMSATQDRPGLATLWATVANVGTADAANVVVRFRDGGTLIGNSAPVTVAQGGTRAVIMGWSTRGQNGTHTITATADPDNRIAESNENNNGGQLTLRVRGNKVQNGSFEQASGSAPANWSGGAGTGYDTTGAHASNGGAAVSATGNGTPASLFNPAWTSAPIAVTPGEIYDLAVTVSTQNVSSAPVLQVSYFDSLGHLLSTATAITTNITGNSPAQTVFGRVTIPAGAGQVRLTLLGFSPTDLSTHGTVWFDDVWVW
jgi:hypothetical protein